MIRRPPRSTLSSSSAASDVYKRQPVIVMAMPTPCSSASQCPPSTVPFPTGVVGCFQCQDAISATKEATSWLLANMPPFDHPNTATLFDGGIVSPTVNLSLTARQIFPWAASVPRSIWESGVLPYSCVNEARTDWRQLMWNALLPTLSNLGSNASLSEAALLVNQRAWSLLGNNGSIRFRSEQTPLVYDPMSTIAFGYASCTGISLTYIAALRTVGIPARLVGTPAWHGDVNAGNHNWVEVWIGADEGEGEWAFIEGAPAGSPEDFKTPKGKWFCNPGHMDGKTQVFGTEWKRGGSISYPMAWDLNNTQIPGVDRTADYVKMCAPTNHWI
eukprot:TRINITY_DN9502_c0_g3_i1.p1 TRINITY_DN9502_c0_g3~~TRINITY_DN9502_c0_g3_i1.p1  ORF type:complete len:330 (+),score=66.52 TRINITY_DN9502_c0_g3_i1:68-1057(+)